MAKVIPCTLLRYLGVDVKAVPSLAPHTPLGMTMMSVYNAMTSKVDFKTAIPAVRVFEAILNAPYRRILKFCRGHVQKYIRKRLGKRLIEYQLIFSYGLATVTGCRLSYFSNERSTKFPPNLDDFKSVMVSNHYQRIVRSQVQFRLIREAYIKHQVENHLCKIGYPAPLFPKILEN